MSEVERAVHDVLSEVVRMLEDATEALESMVTQHLDIVDGGYDHAHLSANEEACDVLAQLRPQRWERTSVGIRRRR